MDVQLFTYFFFKNGQQYGLYVHFLCFTFDVCCGIVTASAIPTEVVTVSELSSIHRITASSIPTEVVTASELSAIHRITASPIPTEVVTAGHNHHLSIAVESLHHIFQLHCITYSNWSGNCIRILIHPLNHRMHDNYDAMVTSWEMWSRNLNQKFGGVDWDEWCSNYE